MAYGNAVLDKGYRAAAAVLKCRFVRFSADNVVTPVTAATQIACGVSVDPVTSAEQLRGKGVTVRAAPGIAEVDVGAGGVTVGTFVMSDATGQAIAAVTAGNYKLGIALQTRAAGLRAAIKLMDPELL